VPDLWRHGLSDAPPAGMQAIGDLAEHHRGPLDTLLTDAYHVVGLSVGGMWAEALAQSSAAVRKLVLMDTYSARSRKRRA